MAEAGIIYAGFCSFGENYKGSVVHLMSQYGSAEGPLVYAMITKDEDKNIGYVQLVPIGEGTYHDGVYAISKGVWKA